MSRGTSIVAAAEFLIKDFRSMHPDDETFEKAVKESQEELTKLSEETGIPLGLVSLLVIAAEVQALPKEIIDKVHSSILILELKEMISGIKQS